MGIKTTISNKGVVNTRVNGSDVLEVNIFQKKAITTVSEGASATISAGATLFLPTTAVGVTGTLPEITSDILGAEYVVLKNSGTNPLLLSGTNPIIGSPVTAVGAWKCAVSASGGRYLCTAVSGTTGKMWFVAGPTF